MLIETTRRGPSICSLCSQAPFFRSSTHQRDVSTIANAIPEREFRPERDVPDGATVVAYCTVGYRSAQFCEKQKHLGVYNLEGGILAHVAHGGEVVGPDGKITNELHCWGPSFRRFAPPQYRTRSYSTLNSVLALPKLYLRKFFL